MQDLFKISLAILFSKIKSQYIRNLIIEFKKDLLTSNEVFNKLKNGSFKNKEDLKLALCIMYRDTNEKQFLSLYNKKFLVFLSKYNSIYRKNYLYYYQYKDNLKQYINTVDINKINTVKQLKEDLSFFEFILNDKLQGFFNICTSLDTINSASDQKDLFNFMVFNLQDLTSCKLINDNLTYSYKFLALKLDLKQGLNKINKFTVNDIEFYVIQYLKHDSLSNILICKKQDLNKASNILQEEKQFKYSNRHKRIFKILKDNDLDLSSNHYQLKEVLDNEDLKYYYLTLKKQGLKQYKKLLKSINKSKYTFIDKEEVNETNIQVLEDYMNTILFDNEVQASLDYIETNHYLDLVNSDFNEVYQDIQDYYKEEDKFKFDSLQEENTSYEDYNLYNYIEF